MVAPTSRRGLPSGRHGLPRELIVRDQRERLHRAMIEVTAEKGYEATTVGDVIESAGVSRTTFYELFKDKEDCFLSTYDTVIDILIKQVQEGYQAHPDRSWPERVHAGLAAMVELFSQQADIARVLMVEVTIAGPAARDRYREALGRFMPFLDEGRAHSEHASMLPPATSRLAIGGAAALIFDELRAGRGTELRKLLPDLVFATLMPFIGPQAAAEEMRRDVGAPAA